MLSKSQARWFFLVATGGFSFVFLGLTVDTILQVPERSNEDQLSAEVVHGKEIWEANNCMGCHTILGEGAYYAPELTRSFETRGPEWIRLFLKDPQAMFPGERKMVQYDLSEDEITAVIAFLEWVGNIDTNGFPAEHDLAPKSLTAASSTTAVALETAPDPFGTVCIACHALGDKGGNIGPALDGVGNRYDRASLDAWLKDPASIKPGTAMPNLGLSDEVRSNLVDWLMTLQ